MNRFHKLDDIQLAARVKSLKHDVDDFRARALKEAAALESAGRSLIGNPLHQRLTSILTFLGDELRSAEAEVRRRAADAAVQRRRSLKEAVLEAFQSIWPIRYHPARQAPAFMAPARQANDALRDTRSTAQASRSATPATPTSGARSLSTRSSHDRT